VYVSRPDAVAHLVRLAAADAADFADI
jgi:hypothetical protein